MLTRPWGSNWETASRDAWNDGPSFVDFLGNPDAPPVARRHLANGGGKGGGGTTYQTSTTQIPQEVLQRYNAVNQRAEQAATQPFQNYGGEFVAPVNSTQQGGIQNITNAAGTADPYFSAATSALNNGLGTATPYYSTAAGQVADATANGAAINSQALGTLNSGLGAAQPFNASAGSAYNSAYAGAQPYQAGATGLALAGTQAVDPNQLNINGFMSPYNDAVVQSTLNLVDQQQGRDLRGQRDQQIMSGGFGGDGANIGRSVLQGQQGLAQANVASNLYNQNYSQALGAAQQQQGVGLGAAQANRAALQTGAGQLANIGQQGYQQGMGYGQAQQGLGQQIFGQGAAASQGQAAIGQQGYAQGLGAAQANQAIGQGLYGMGSNAATTMAGLGTGQQTAQLQQGQAQIGAGTIQQQTQQAQDQAVYNQFLQQQGYPFQVAQFLANIAEGTGALSGSTTSGSTSAPQPFFSDERLKEDIRTIGHTKDGLRIVSYRYKGSPHTQIGMLAQDVEKKRPEAVGLAEGYKTVDYDAATRKALGGAVANDNRYAEGGGVLDQAALAQLLMAHQAMYPGAMNDRAGVTSGAGPRGLQLRQPTARSLPANRLPEVREQEPQLRSAMRTASDVAGAGKGIGDLYSIGKDALVGSAAKGSTPATGGLAGQGGKWDPDKGWIGRQTGASTAGGLGGAGTSPAGSIKTEALPAPALETPSAATPSPVGADTGTIGQRILGDATGNVAEAAPAALGTVDEALDIFARRGGRIKRYASGGMPYGNAEGYLPDDLYQPMDPNKLADAQKGLGAADKAASSSGSKSSSGKSGIGSTIGSLAGLGIGSLFGMPSLGAMGGGLLGGLFNKGGRAGYDDGGGVVDVIDPDDRSYYDRLALESREKPSAGLGAAAPAPGQGLPTNADPVPIPSRGREANGPPAPPAPTDSNVVPFPPRGLAPKPDAIDAGPDGRYVDTPPESPKAPTGLAPLPPPRAVAAGDNFDASPNVAKRHWIQESGDKQFRPDGSPITSSVGAVGRSQLHSAGPDAAKLAGVAWDPERAKTDEAYNRLLGDTWFNHLNEVYKDPYKATAAYNAGSGAVDNAVKLATVKGGSYADYLPGETQNHLYVVSGGKIGKPAGQGITDRALSLVGDRQAPSAAAPATDTPSAASGLAPIPTGIDLAMPPKDRKDGSWLDRNERTIVTGLTFLGNMLGSPSRQLPGAIGHGLAAAAPAYFEMGQKQQHAGQEQQGIQLGGQRLDIQQRAQYIGLLTQLRTMQNARLGRGLPEDPALSAQISHLAKIVGGAESPAPGSAPAAPSASPAGAPPTPASPSLPPPGPAAVSGPPQAGPTGIAAPPPAGGPAPDLAAKHPALAELPPQLSSPQFLAQLHPEQNPIELYKRADAIVDDGDPNGAHARAVARADAAVQGMKERGYAYDKNMMPIIVPGMPQTQRAMQMIPQNTVWSQKESVANNERQGARQSLDLIRKALEQYQTNALGDVTADVQRHARALGIDIPDGAKWNAAAVQEIIKQSAARAATAGDTDMARSLSRLANIDPTKEPEANKQILAQSYADLNARDSKYNYLQPRISAVPQLDTPYEEQRWAQANPREKFYEDAYKDIAVRGSTPEPSKMKEGHTYIIEPGQYPGVVEPGKYKFTRNEKGRVGLQKVQ